MSIQAGRITPSTILNKLGTYTKKNKLFQAFLEIGRVIRTKILLQYMSKKELRYKFINIFMIYLRTRLIGNSSKHITRTCCEWLCLSKREESHLRQYSINWGPTPKRINFFKPSENSDESSEQNFYYNICTMRN